MIRGFVVLALVGAALCAPINSFDEIPAQYKELIPDDAAKVLKELTDTDKAALKAIAMRHTEFKNEEEAFAALKTESAETYEKVMKLHKYVNDKIEALQPETKEFAKKVIGEARRLHALYIAGQKPNLETLKTKAVEFINAFKALTPESKADFENHFPILTSVVKNDKFQTMATAFLGPVN